MSAGDHDRRREASRNARLRVCGTPYCSACSSPVHTFQPLSAQHLGARLPHGQHGRDLLPGQPLVGVLRGEVQRRENEARPLVADLEPEEAEVVDVR